MSAWRGEHGLTFGQLTTEENSNEIKVVPKLLDMLDVKGDVVTAYAMNCQKEIARNICEKSAEHILAVKRSGRSCVNDIGVLFYNTEYTCYINLCRSAFYYY
jgi:predicted transposase YbfD/YdcC